jgi:Fe-S cluster biogenesis protein NfuA
MTVHDQAEAALSSLCECFQADGANLELVSVESATARVRLVFPDETCQECTLPGSMLQPIFETTLRRACPELEGVELDDPRES